MVSISSNTIVKNGMPFIGRVLRQIAPYMEKMIVHYSVKSDDKTLDELMKVYHEVCPKMIITREDVELPAQLTEIRNEQVKMTESDWILFLDDDDYWPRDQLQLCLNELDIDEEVLAYSVIPYQLVDKLHYDYSWRKRSFSKFLRRKDLRYIKPWPRDLPADKDNSPLYHKTHPQVKSLSYKYFHLSHLKNGSFRKEEWAKKFIDKNIHPIQFDNPEIINEVNKIYEFL